MSEPPALYHVTGAGKSPLLRDVCRCQGIRCRERLSCRRYLERDLGDSLMTPMAWALRSPDHPDLPCAVRIPTEGAAANLSSSTVDLDPPLAGAGLFWAHFRS